MRFRLYIVLIILVLASSCGEYEKLLKSTDSDLKKEKAKEYYAAGQYVKSSELLGQILPRYRATEEAEELNWIHANSFYGMKDYYMAGSYFKVFVDQFPFGKHAEEAHFLVAMCDYKISPRSELDQENTRNALEEFFVFINKYAYSPKVEECKKYISELQDKLVDKSHNNARLYYDMKEYKAAVVAINNSLKQYSNSIYREEMMYLKLSSLYLYAMKSMPDKQKTRYQDTLDDYYSFMEEFPKSKYSKDVDDIFQKTNKFLQRGNPPSVVNN
ncbi:MAG: outer membrane protein assembly factor BamD [Bacteroidales bacterium]|nr:outer membrane protein assembly factor BamD [Bacteroidales bacterium]MBK8883149.1 outer membrane protein assembly factor BamD [Bacteroidales bacterium]